MTNPSKPKPKNNVRVIDSESSPSDKPPLTFKEGQPRKNKRKKSASVKRRRTVLPEFEKEPKRRSSGRARRGSKTRLRNYKRFAVLAAAAFLVACGFAIRKSRDGLEPDDNAYKITSPSDEGASRPADPKSWKGMLPAEIAERFLNSSSVPEKIALIRFPGRNGELLESFFLEGEGSKESVTDITEMGVVFGAKHSFQRFHVKFVDGKNRLLCVLLSEEGAKVDFRSYARYCSVGWPELLAGRAKSAEEVRVFVAAGPAYFDGYSDELKWRSYVVTSPDLTETMYFYTERETDADRELAEIASGGNARATLAIRCEGDGYTKRQFEVSEVLAAGWVE